MYGPPPTRNSAAAKPAPAHCPVPSHPEGRSVRRGRTRHGTRGRRRWLLRLAEGRRLWRRGGCAGWTTGCGCGAGAAAPPERVARRLDADRAAAAARLRPRFCCVPIEDGPTSCGVSSCVRTMRGVSSITMSVCATVVSLLENSCLMTGSRSSHGKPRSERRSSSCSRPASRFDSPSRSRSLRHDLARGERRQLLPGDVEPLAERAVLDEAAPARCRPRKVTRGVISR